MNPAAVSAGELDEFRATLRKFATDAFSEKAAYWDAEEEFPKENRDLLAKLGHLGLVIPEQYGGSGLSILHATVFLEEVARVCFNTALICQLAVNGPSRVIEILGSEDQKKRFLPQCASGEYMFGIGALVVGKGMPGFEVGKPDRKMGGRGVAEAELFFDNVRVPASNVVTAGRPGELQGLRRGAHHLQLDAGRHGRDGARRGRRRVRASARLHARAPAVRPAAGRHAGPALDDDRHVDRNRGRSLCYRALSVIDAGKPDPCLSSVAKVHATEMAIKVTFNCQQMFGGYGYFGLLPLERMVRDVRMLTVTGGTTQTQKNAIANHIFPR